MPARRLSIRGSTLMLASICLVAQALIAPGAAQAAPANDDFANRTMVTLIPFTETILTIGAGTEDGEQLPTCGEDVGATVWYQYTPPVDLTLTAHTTDSDFDTVLGVWTGTTLGSLSEVACNDDDLDLRSAITFPATGGTTYLFQAGGYREAAGNLHFSLFVGGSIRGIVTEETTGIPLEGICVDVLDQGGELPRGSAVTDATGAYRVGGLPTANYNVFFVDICDEELTHLQEYYDNHPEPESADLVTVTMGDTADIDAQLTHLLRRLAVNKAGTGTGTVTSSPAGINCGGDCTESYEPGTVVTLTAAGTGGSTFGGWSGGGCTGTTSTCVMTLDNDTTVTATFGPGRTLTVNKAGTGTGTITSSPAGINCGTDCTESYPSATSVTLSATVTGDSVFAGWGGACTGTDPTCSLNVDADTSVTARFDSRPTLQIVKAGAGTGTVSSSPAGIACGTDCSEDYDLGTEVTLTASPAEGSTFAKWTGGGCGESEATCTLTLNQDTTVTATFAKPEVADDPRCADSGVLCGDSGSNLLIGTASNDLILGFEGDDVCRGGEGDDTIVCSAGNDKLSGGPGNDVLRSTTGDDTLRGGVGNDVLSGGDDKDLLVGGKGKDRLRGGPGVDRCRETAGSERGCER